MIANKPLFWHQGLFLQPHHFQYHDLAAQEMVGALRRTMQPFNWGIQEFVLNIPALSTGVFDVQKIAAVMPDGTQFHFPEDAVLAPRNFSSVWAERNKPFRVYFGVKRLSRADANVTIVADREMGTRTTTRYIAIGRGEEINDLYQGGQSANIKALDMVLRIFWEEEVASAAGYEIIPLAQLVQDGDSIQLDAQYAPPSLNMSSATALMRAIKELRDDLVSRARQLEEYKGGEAGQNDAGHRMIRYQMALQVLGRYAPMLAHYIDADYVHPWHAYATLRQLIGELSVFSARVDVLGSRSDGGEPVNTYDHLAAGQAFRAAKNVAELLLNEITVGPELMANMERVDHGRFTATLNDAFLDRNVAHYLVLRTERAFDSLLDSFKTFSKLGAKDEVDIYVKRALPGLSVRYLQVRPEGLPYRPNAYYFRLDRRDAPWETIERYRDIALLWDDAPEDLKVELVVVRR
jgi:type VI secretion system protein ImpJ